MTPRRFVEIVEFCVHGRFEAHAVVANDHLSSDRCSGGSRRALVEGRFILIEKEDGSWPKWVNQYHLRLGTTSDLLDALAEDPK